MTRSRWSPRSGQAIPLLATTAVSVQRSPKVAPEYHEVLHVTFTAI
ncbi:MAG: hypothetical protein HGA45_03080 [Chloroflexales bacterium]|nr:hypothetical protein [Chloroflexales bacterium]